MHRPISAKKLPPHWLFVPSKRQVRELLAELGADVRLVEFYGTGYGRNPDRLSLGLVESRVVGGGWCFYLHLWGVREAVAGRVREELAAAALTTNFRTPSASGGRPGQVQRLDTSYVLAGDGSEPVAK